jgi:hypothetical protein
MSHVHSRQQVGGVDGDLSRHSAPGGEPLQGGGCGGQHFCPACAGCDGNADPAVSSRLRAVCNLWRKCGVTEHTRTQHSTHVTHHALQSTCTHHGVPTHREALCHNGALGKVVLQGRWGDRNLTTQHWGGACRGRAVGRMGGGRGGQVTGQESQTGAPRFMHRKHSRPPTWVRVTVAATGISTEEFPGPEVANTMLVRAV